MVWSSASQTAARGVRAISEEEAVETLEARAVLEGLAVRYAARNVTDGDIADLRAIVGEMEARLAEGDLLGISEGNTRLHSRLLQIANNKTVAGLIERLHAQHIRRSFASFWRRAARRAR